MKNKLKPVVVSLSIVLSGLSTNIWADTNTAANQEELSAQIQSLSKQAQALQDQLSQLQAQMVALQKQQPTSAAAPNTFTPKAATASTPSTTTTGKTTNPPSTASSTTETKPSFEAAAKEHPSLPYGGKLNLSRLGGTAVISSPFIESNSDFGGSDLIVNYSTIKKDVAVLDQRQNFENMMSSIGIDAPQDSLIELSGMLEGQVFGNRAFSGNKQSDINLSSAELDIQAHVNPIITGFMSIAYDDGAPEFGSRVSNSNIYLNNGFITFGNFNKSPFYGTIGQMYVPFGYFSTYLISNPFNKTMFRTEARPIEVGFQQAPDSGAYFSLYGFKGTSDTGEFDPATQTVTAESTINTYGLDGGYRFRIGPFKTNIGGSYISNSTDADGMQSTDAVGDRFQGFGSSSSSEVLEHKVPAADVRGSINYKPLTVWAEYATNTEAFSPVDLTYNGHGAKPSGLHVESDYAFPLFTKPSTFVLAYDQSAQALGLNVPQRGYSTGLSSSIWEHTLETIELHHYVNYSDDDTASGDEQATFTVPGKISNAIIGQLDVYF